MSDSEDKWREKLSPQQFKICREGGTEPPFSGKLLHNKEKGSYHCACCGALLFESDTKFDSHSGWPSFWDAHSSAIKMEQDTRHGMIRTEVKCAHCDAHLGHLFEDGPRPTGLRYCINSASLDFQTKK